MVEDLRFTDEEIIRLGVNLGITGKLFKSKGLFFADFLTPKDDTANDKESEEGNQSGIIQSGGDKRIVGFNSDIDNLSGIRNIEGYILAAMTDINDLGQQNCKGVIQIYNKDRSKVLDNTLSMSDAIRIKALQKLLGAAVTRSEVYSTCLTTLLGLGMFMETSQVMGTKHNIIDDEFIHSLYDIANMVSPMEAVRRHLDNYNADKI